MTRPAGALTTRPATTRDAELLSRLTLGERAGEPAGGPQTAAFLQLQRLARERPLPPPPPAANDHVILLAGEPVGRLWLDEHDGALWIVQLTLLPERRGVGIGTAVLRELMERIDTEGRPLALYTEAGGRAHALYLRLGFRAIGRRGIHVALRWTPGDRTPARA